MKVYDGNAFQNAGSSVNGTSQRNKFIATANQTTFSGNDADGVKHLHTTQISLMFT